MGGRVLLAALGALAVTSLPLVKATAAPSESSELSGCINKVLTLDEGRWQYMGVSACLAPVLASEGLAQETETSQAIQSVINAYIRGTAENDRTLVSSAFYKGATLFLDHRDHEVFTMTPDEFAALYDRPKNAEEGPRLGRILSIETSGKIAFAKAEIVLPEENMRFVDMFLLQRIGDHWKIIAKAAAGASFATDGESATVVIDEDSSFESIAIEYERLMGLGYLVHIASDQGGRIVPSFDRLDSETSTSLLFDQDFMQAIGNTQLLEAIQGGPGSVFVDLRHKPDGIVNTSTTSLPVKQTIVDGLSSPWSAAFLTESDVLITEKQGGIVRADLRTGKRVRLTGLPSDLRNKPTADLLSDNSGLFEIVLDPNFSQTRWVYVSYSAKTADGRTTTKIIRARLKGNALRDTQTLFVAEPFTVDEYYHYGGGMSFGADGLLYFTIGERLYSEGNQPALPIAQDYTDRRGKIYRINSDGSIPEDNPDFGENTPPGLFAIGIRASQGMALNNETRQIWFSDHGAHQGDEVNRLKAGANYGWPIKTTGTYRDPDYVPPELPDREFEAPQWSWPHTVAPTGMAFYYGPEFPNWHGSLFVSGLSRGSLWRFSVRGGEIRAAEELFVDDRVRLRNVVTSPRGALYVLADTMFVNSGDDKLTHSGGPNGSLIRITRAASVETQSASASQRTSTTID